MDTINGSIAEVRANTNAEDTSHVLREISINSHYWNTNINSLPVNYEKLKLVIGNYLDILLIQDTKLDSSFLTTQFMINGYNKQYRLDSNPNGRGCFNIYWGRYS